MIRNFKDRETERIWNGERSRAFPHDIQDIARRKLRLVNRTINLYDFRIPRGNRFEQLKGSDPLRYSIRINDQWRITFNWSDGGALNVRIEDYHRG